MITSNACGSKISWLNLGSEVMAGYIEPSVMATTIVARNFNSSIGATTICAGSPHDINQELLNIPIPKLKPEPKPTPLEPAKPKFDFITRLQKLEL